MKRIFIVPMIRLGLAVALVFATMFSVSCVAPPPPDPCLTAVQALADEINNAWENYDPPACLDELDAWCDCLETSPDPPGDYGPSCVCPAILTIAEPCEEWQGVLDNCDGVCLQSFMTAPQAQKNAANAACLSSSNQRQI